MKLRFLTLANLISGLIFSVLEIPFSQKHTDKDIPGYTLKSNIKAQQSGDTNNIGLYLDSKGSTVFIKSLSYRFKNLFYEQLMNEASLLYVFNRHMLKKSEVSFSKLINIIDTQNTLSIIIESISGKKLSEYSQTKKVEVLSQCLKTLNSLTNNLTDSEKERLPKRSNLLIFSTFPLYFILSLVKERINFKLHLANAIRFYKYFPYQRLFSTKYVLSHKDLSSENILVKNNHIYIIDPEVSTLSEDYTELATVARFYHQELSENKLITFILDHLLHSKDDHTFAALTIYYSYQMLTIEKKDSQFYDQAISYLDFFSDKLLPKLSLSFSLAERIYFFSLQFIKFFTNVIPFSIKPKNPIILCYHSISNDPWRFATKAADFESQIQYLKNNFSVLPLSKLLATNNQNAISITFDDGYKDIFTTALPILKKHKLTATVFVLGRPDKANRQELDNDIVMMNESEIKKLKQEGWEIGYHSATHANLIDLSSSAIRYEIQSSKDSFEKKSRLKLQYMAYPRGLYNNEVVSISEKEGYKKAFTVEGGSITDHKAFLIPRVPMEGKISKSEFEGLLTSLGILFSKLFMKILEMKESLSHPKILISLNKGKLS